MSAVVRLTNPMEVFSISAIVSYDPSVVSHPRVDLTGTATADWEFTSWENHRDRALVTFSSLADFLPPFEARALAPGENQSVLRLVFAIPSTAPAGDSLLAFVDEIDQPRLRTEVVVHGTSVVPEWTDGVLHVIGPEPPSAEVGSFSVGAAATSPGGETRLPLHAVTLVEAEGLTVVGDYDSPFLELLDVDVGQSLAGNSSDFVAPTIDAERGQFLLSVLFDLPPLEGKALPPGDHLLASLVFRVKPGTPEGSYPVRLTDGLGAPPRSNFLVSNGENQRPRLENGALEVRSGETDEPAAVFLRGDANGNGKLEISDAIYLLSWQVREGPPPPCLDAADTDDDGLITRADANLVLGYLIGGLETPPAPPFPEVDADLTEDGLDCQTGL